MFSDLFRGRCRGWDRHRACSFLCSDRVPAISFVGSDGGILTIGADPADEEAGGGGGEACVGVSMARAYLIAATGQQTHSVLLLHQLFRVQDLEGQRSRENKPENIMRWKF